VLEALCDGACPLDKTRMVTLWQGLAFDLDQGGYQDAVAVQGR
jgi:hypothetical protein